MSNDSVQSAASLFTYDALTCVMVGLVAVVATVIARFSWRYLDGQPARGAAAAWFAATLVCVLVLVSTNHLLLLVAAWTASGLCLHQLITFFPARRAALVAAHKKFLVGRVADVITVIGALTLGRTLNTFAIDGMASRVAVLNDAGQVLPISLHVGAGLFALGVIMRSAVLPFHGWLIQIMEAPTPVSAFLHAGIVNMGGFVMIRFGALMVHADAAQLLLVVVGAGTAVLSALVMMTRVSIKVSLAWSTSAQMGFVLMECGLGAYDLALLHLLAHSLYKAHAFLTSGMRVAEHLRVGAAPATRGWRPTLSVLIGAVVVGGALVIELAVRRALGDAAASLTPSTIALAVVLALAIASMPSVGAERNALWWAIGSVASITVAHHAMALMLPARVSTAATSSTGTGALWRAAVVVAAFGSLAVTQWLVLTRPQHAFVRWLYPRFLAGFYLDEWLTKITFRVWPLRSPVAAAASATQRVRVGRAIAAAARMHEESAPYAEVRG